MPADSLIPALGGYDLQWWHVALAIGVLAALSGVFVALGGLRLLRRVWQRVSQWSRTKQIAAAAALVLGIAGLAFAIYKQFDRPGDVLNEDVGFEVAKEKKKRVVKKVDWPVYGYDDARTRYLPSKRVNPPYDASEWSFNAGKLLEFSPVLHEDRLFIVDKDSLVIALDSEKGKVIWKHDVGALSAASPAYADGRLFVVTLEPGNVQALDPRNGKRLWERDLGARSETSPVIYGDTVIVGNESGTVFALDVKSGETKWSVDSAGAVKGGVALDEGIVYFGNYAGEVFAIRASNGDVKWQTGTLGGSFGRTGRIYSTPAVGYGRVYVGSIDSRIYSFDADTGALAWSQSTGAEVYSGPALAEVGDGPATIYIGSADKSLYALDARTGAVRWKQFTGGILLGAASVIGHVVYVGVIGPQNGTIGYNANTGARVFEHELGEYNPAISDGHNLYLTGLSSMRSFPPDLTPDKPKKKGKKGKKAGKKGSEGEKQNAGNK